MPNIKIVNIRFNLDNDERDRQIHDALFQYPAGGRNQVVKEALYLYLIGDDTEKPQRAAEVQTGPVRTPARTPKTPVPKHGSVYQQSSGQAEQPLATTGAEADDLPLAQEPDNDRDKQVMAGLRSMIQ